MIFKTLRELLVASRNFPGPVISIVSGHAIAGGCLLALASDYRYGVHGMHRMGLNEMAIGIDLPPDMLSIISHTINLIRIKFIEKSQLKAKHYFY